MSDSLSGGAFEGLPGFIMAILIVAICACAGYIVATVSDQGKVDSPESTYVDSVGVGINYIDD